MLGYCLAASREPESVQQASESALSWPESLAVEVETTGKRADVLHNLKQDLLAGFQRVIFVATNQRAFEKVTRVLEEAKLLIPSRVRVVLRDRFSDNGL